MQTPVYALVDANNFYATCETALDPSLRGRPLLVLSNNDGCIISRSAEARALGIPMGVAIHEWRGFCRHHGVVIKSSNYALYGDMSARMLQVLQDMCPLVESYSIDESFLDLSGMPGITDYCHEIRTALKRRALMTCGVGIGATKTLAKLANHVAKAQPEWHGVFNMLDHSPTVIEELMARLPVGEVWGVGRRLSKRLEADGIKTVLDFKSCAPAAVRRRYGISLERTVRELQGDACLDLENLGAPRRQIMVSRSFGQPLMEYTDIRAAVTHHIVRAAEKLRRQNSMAQLVYVMLQASSPGAQAWQRLRTELVPLTHATADSGLLIRAALEALKRNFEPGCRYKKAGVMLGQITDRHEQQADLFARADDPRRLQLMELLDTVNRKHGRDMLHYAGADISRRWIGRAGDRSPMYTTRWSDIPVAHG